jgi:trimethylamine--corrinoid protein Co-methyltransferase
MSTENMSINGNFLKVLSQSDVESIHHGSLKVLKETGVKIQDKETLEMLAEYGCKIDLSNQVAKFPEKLIMDCLEKAPSSFVLKAREDENNCLISSGGPFISAPAPGLQSVDLDTWEPKKPTRKDFYDYMRIIDALPNYDMQVGFPWAGFEGVPACMQLLESCAAKFRVSSKPNWEGTIDDCYFYNTKMAKALDVDLWQNTNPTSPLTFQKETVEQMKYFTQNDMPFSMCSGPVMGVSGPATIAGTLTLNNADILAGNVIAQLFNEHSRLLAGSMIMTINMRTASPIFANVANFLADSAFNQMWAYYGLPTLCNLSGWSNSKMLDYQAAYETVIGATMSILSGASVLAFGGGLTAELTGHPVKAIIDNDIIGMMKRTLKGIEVTDDTLALDVINEVGFAPASYLAELHTSEWWRNDIYTPEVADMLTIKEWVGKGKKTIIDHGRQRMEEILQTHKIKELQPDKEQAIEDVLREARETYRKRGLITDDEWKLYMKDISSPNYPYA